MFFWAYEAFALWDNPWWTAWIVWPDRPGVCSANYGMPVPPENGLVSEGKDGERELETDS